MSKNQALIIEERKQKRIWCK